MMQNLLAQASDIIGEIDTPPGITSSVEGGGLRDFINSIILLLIVGAGIFAVINFVLAGYGFMSAGDDPKRIQAAWSKIWQTLLGLSVAAGAFVLAAIFGQLIFGEATALLQLRIYTP